MAETITISTLARVLGLAESTVSKALNDRGDVSAEVKLRVRACAEELGYRPNLQAQRLARKSSDTLGVFLLNRFARPVHEYFGYSFLGGIMDEAEVQGKDVLILNGPPGPEGSVLASCLELARAKGVEGVILIGLGLAEGQKALPENFPLPVISIDTPLVSPGTSMVSTDNAKGIEALTKQLLASGSRRPAYLGLRGNGYVAQERRRGHLQALLEHAMEPVLFECPLDREAARLAALEILSLPSVPDALVCGSDLQALGVLEAARERGIRVPQDLQVTGFDNIPLAGLADPPLTTWAQDPVAMGREAVRLCYGGPLPPKPVLCPGKAVQRSSTKGAPYE